MIAKGTEVYTLWCHASSFTIMNLANLGLHTQVQKLGIFNRGCLMIPPQKKQKRRRQNAIKEAPLKSPAISPFVRGSSFVRFLSSAKNTHAHTSPRPPPNPPATAAVLLSDLLRSAESRRASASRSRFSEFQIGSGGPPVPCRPRGGWGLLGCTRDVEIHCH